MKRYIARIKLHKKALFDIRASGRDYIVSFPKSGDILDNGGYFNFHFTLHTANNRVTHKVTDFGNDTKNFNDVLSETDQKNFYVSRDKEGVLKDIDLTKGKKFLKLDDPRFIGNIFTFGINDVHNKGKKITDFFGESKKADERFKNVINLEFPEYLTKAKIRLKVCKNFLFDPLLAHYIKGIKYEKAFVVEDKNEKNLYKFLIFIEKDLVQ